MRAEVIRDHQRQQRAQRATAPTLPTTTPAAGTSGASGSGEAAAAPPAAPLVEPIDQEFLAALPPELQEVCCLLVFPFLLFHDCRPMVIYYV